MKWLENGMFFYCWCFVFVSLFCCMIIMEGGMDVIYLKLDGIEGESQIKGFEN